MMGPIQRTRKGAGTSRPPRKVEHAQNISRMCLVCGRDNAFGLHARFYELAPGESPSVASPGDEPEGSGSAVGRELLGIFSPREEHQSYPGRLHGGVSSAILDETIGRAVLLDHQDIWGVTVEFSVRFRRPLPLDGEIRCVARITRDTSRLFEGSGEILLPDGTVAVEGTGKYLKQTLGDITEDDFAEREWFADPRVAPDEIDV
jgi:hypothetical protein